jgi:hypothetical protein
MAHHAHTDCIAGGAGYPCGTCVTCHVWATRCCLIDATRGKPTHVEATVLAIAVCQQPAPPRGLAGKLQSVNGSETWPIKCDSEMAAHTCVIVKVSQPSIRWGNGWQLASHWITKPVCGVWSHMGYTCVERSVTTGGISSGNS